MLDPCPRLACPHPASAHDWLEPGVAPMCCADGCDCGKRPEHRAEDARRDREAFELELSGEDREWIAADSLAERTADASDCPHQGEDHDG